MLLYTPESVYHLDKAAVEQDQLAEIELMQRAGARVWQAVIDHWPGISAITVFAGAGNNGGDAFVVALCAQAQGIDVQLLIQGDLEGQSPTSRHFRDQWERAGEKFEDWNGQALRGDVIVDGLLGIGLKRALDMHWQDMIAAINRADAPRVAIDIPSGLNGLTGIAQPVAVEAQVTVTFIGAKTGLYLSDGPDYCGELIFDDLGVSEQARGSAPAVLRVIDSCRLPPPRKKNTHKNHYGHLLVIGGDQGMSGAVALAALAALRSGAGLVTALVHPECRGNLASVPEIMVREWDALDDKLALASVVVIGPGLGDSEAARRCLQLLQPCKLPMVIDAGALDADFMSALDSKQVVITPHPGEAAALLDTTSSEVQSDRLDACTRLAETFGATCVLKGSGTLVGKAGELTAINTHGNPGMASAGMGDVLSGIVAALIGQGLDCFAAAATAVYIHALCAEDYAKQQDQAGLIASDIIDRIPQVIKALRDAR